MSPRVGPAPVQRFAGRVARHDRSARRDGRRLLALALVFVALLPGSRSFARTTVRAAYFYDYMPLQHLDSLAATRFNRALVRLVGDSLSIEQAERVRMLAQRGNARGVPITPDLLLQAPARLEALHTRRRYTWGRGVVEPRVACPLDSAYWRSALLDHLDELLRVVPDLRSVAVDLELYDAGRKHYDAGPCRCAACLAEYTGGTTTTPDQAWKLSGLHAYQEARLTALFTRLLHRFAAAHPGVEFSVLDLDFDSFVHRALARALARTRVPTTDFTERSYRSGGAAIAAARGRLDALGLVGVPLVGGLWLKRWPPRDVASGVRSVLDRADGYFVFTTYSLWFEQARLTGPYTLPGTPTEYWRALRDVNHTP